MGKLGLPIEVKLNFEPRATAATTEAKKASFGSTMKRCWKVSYWKLEDLLQSEASTVAVTVIAKHRFWKSLKAREVSDDQRNHQWQAATTAEFSYTFLNILRKIITRLLPIQISTV